MRLRRPSFEALLTGAFVVAGALWGGFLGVRQINGLDAGLDRVEYLTLDWRFLLAGARPAPRGVIIAAVDDEALRIAVVRRQQTPRRRLCYAHRSRAHAKASLLPSDVLRRPSAIRALRSI